MRILLTVLLALLLLAAAAAFLIWPRRGQWQLQELRRFRYAHRGLFNPERGVPENSVKAFRYAVAGGFGIELDVRLTGDKRLAVVHDSTLMRLCVEKLGAQAVNWTIRSQEELEEAERAGGVAIFEGFLPKGEIPVGKTGAPEEKEE